MTLHPVLVHIPQPADRRTPQGVEQQRHYARVALSHCGVLCGAPTEGWRNDEEGRPLSNAGFHWSVSHKRQLAAAVISDCPVGIDVEHVLPRREEVLDELAADDEWDILGDRSWQCFFRLWTAKEAVLKANGLGIAALLNCRLLEVRDLHHMRLDVERASWLVVHHYLEDHVAAVACHGEAIEWHTVRDTTQ